MKTWHPYQGYSYLKSPRSSGCTHSLISLICCCTLLHTSNCSSSTCNNGVHRSKSAYKSYTLERSSGFVIITNLMKLQMQYQQILSFEVIIPPKFIIQESIKDGYLNAQVCCRRAWDAHKRVSKEKQKKQKVKFYEARFSWFLNFHKFLLFERNEKFLRYLEVLNRTFSIHQFVG